MWPNAVPHVRCRSCSAAESPSLAVRYCSSRAPPAEEPFGYLVFVFKLKLSLNFLAIKRFAFRIPYLNPDHPEIRQVVHLVGHQQIGQRATFRGLTAHVPGDNGDVKRGVREVLVQLFGAQKR